jgi:hypothetical protein
MYNKIYAENLIVYEIMWGKKMVQPDRSQMIIQRGAGKMQFTCRITKARIHTRNTRYLLLHTLNNSV